MSTKRTRRLEVELFGRGTEFEYSEHWVGYALVTLRVTMGWVLLQEGLTELVTYLDADPSNDWTAAGYLASAVPAGNPFVDAFAAMAGSPLVDALNMWGLTLTGLALVLGAFGAGRVLGPDARLERLEVVRNNRRLRYLLGSPGTFSQVVRAEAVGLVRRRRSPESEPVPHRVAAGDHAT